MTDKTLRSSTKYTLDYHLYLRSSIWKRLRARFPVFKRRPRLLSLLIYLINGPTDSVSGLRPLSARIVSFVYHGDHSIERDRNIRVAEDVAELCAVTGCKIGHTNYDKAMHRAREAYEFVPSPEVSKIVFANQAPFTLREGLVNLITGELITPAERHAYHTARLAQADEKNAQCQHEECRTWLNYMNHEVTIEMLRPKAVNAINALNYAHNLTDANERCYAIDALESLLVLPHMPYEYSERTVRLFGKGYNPQNIAAELRQRLWPDLYELDLTSCQLAIFAKVCDVPKINEFLHSGKNIWEYLAQQCGLRLTATVKEVLKTVLYEIIFGAAEHTLFWKMASRSLTAEQLAVFTDDVQECFRKIPEIEALLKARDRTLKDIRKAKGKEDAYGQWVPVVKTGPKEERVNPRSVLAQVIQSWEFRLLAPFRELTLSEGRGSHGWTCIIWSHDGASIRIKHPARDAKSIINKICMAVNSYAASLGFATRIEIKSIN